VADVSHELRTPLTTIGGVLDLAVSRRLRGADLDEGLRRAHDEERRMASLIEDLLLLARFDQEPRLNLARVDLVAVLADAAGDVALRQPDRIVELDLPEEAVLEADEARIRQVVSNLVANALAYTPEETGLWLRVRPAPDTVTVEIADAGPGLSAEQARHVFERFYRTDAGRSRRSGGAGLGLSIAQSIITAHGGRIQLRRHPDAGVTFSFTLPR
jgi:two-component system OmpR family sensor kinase